MAASNRLLVADDSLTIQKVIRLALSNEGYDIQAVSDGNDAVEQIFLFRPNLVLIDVSLPGLNAFEVKREINQHPEHAQTRFVLMSSAFEKIDEIQAADVKFQGRLTKPFDPAHLRQIILEALNKGVVPKAPLPSMPNLPPLPEVSPAEDRNERQSHYQDHRDEFQPSASFPPSGRPSVPPPFVTPSMPPSSLPPFPPSFENPGSFASDLGSPDLAFESESVLPPDFPRELPGEAEPAGGPPDFPPTPGEGFLSDSFHPDSVESEIKHLTDTTFEMADSEVDQWSVSPPPSPPPLQIRPETDISKFLVPPPAPASPPTPPQMPPHLPMTEPDQRAYAPPLPVFAQPIASPPPVDPSRVHLGLPPSAAQQGTFSLSDEKVERIVKTQVEQMLQKLIQNSLPEMAEKLIKQEIHKMLSDPSL